VRGGYVNAVGLANPGVEEASSMLREAVRAATIPVIASVAAGNPGEWADAVAKLVEAGVAAIELNLSCPHFEGGGIELGQDPSAVYRVVREAAGAAGRVPVIAKLGVSDRLVEAASRALEAGARGLTLINSVRAMKIDVYTARPVLSNRVGGLSGPAIHPIAVRAVYEVYRETGADIFGVGGVETWEDAAELMMAGARAVQVGAAIVEKGPRVLGEIAEGLRRFLWIQGYRSVEEIVGAAARA
jgi:dihydroorotate dehydrogenase (NAD+) catalytic subunit